jgi:hypothetical protein
MDLKPMMLTAMAGLAITLVAGCTEHKVRIEPIEVKPIYIKADVNIKVDRELDSFFDFEDELQPNIDESKEGGN